MASKLIARSGLCGALWLSLSPVLAQEAGGVQSVFGIQQGVEISQNESLSIPGSGTTTTTTSTLSYGLSSETRTERLGFDIAGTYRLEFDDDDTSGTFDGPRMTLAYSRQGAEASLSASANYAVSEVDTLLSLEDFVDADGLIDPPEDFTDLVGTGQRTTYGANATLITGINAPFGLQLDVGVSGTTYQDTTDPDLIDIARSNIALGTRLQFSPVLTGTVGLRYAVTEEDDAEETRRTVSGIDLGMVYDVSPRSRLAATIGTEQTDTERNTGDTETSGLTGQLAFDYAMPNGSIGAVFDATRDVDGDQILSFRVNRGLDLPAGSLSATLGVTRPEDEDTALIGSLDWTLVRPTSRLLLNLEREVTVDEDADTRQRTRAGAFYDYDINTVSSLGLAASYVIDEESSATNRVTRGDLTATYSYALTENWDLSTGLGFSTRDEDTVGSAEASQISFTIGREFSARQ